MRYFIEILVFGFYRGVVFFLNITMVTLLNSSKHPLLEDTSARIVNQLTSRHPCKLNESSFYSHENERWFWNGEGALGCRPSLGGVWDGGAEQSYWLNQGVCMVGGSGGGGWIGKGMEAAGCRVNTTFIKVSTLIKG